MIDLREIKNHPDYPLIKLHFERDGFLWYDKNNRIKIFRPEIAAYFSGEIDVEKRKMINEYIRGYEEGEKLWNEKITIRFILMNPAKAIAKIHEIASVKEDYRAWDVQYMDERGFYEHGKDAPLIYEAQSLLQTMGFKK